MTEVERGPMGEADARTRILAAASRLIAAGGVAALTTRAVAAAALVQAPTLYRLFGDKRGLLDAVAEHGLGPFVGSKAIGDYSDDPVEDLRQAWDAYVAFGLGHPAVFAIMNEVGRQGPPSPAVAAGLDILRERVRRIARGGQLRIPEDRAVGLIHATGTGVVTTLLTQSDEERDPQLSPVAREAVISALVGTPGSTAGSEIAMLAIGLRAHLEAIDELSSAECRLLGEWLSRLATPRETEHSSRNERTAQDASRAKERLRIPSGTQV